MRKVVLRAKAAKLTASAHAALLNWPSMIIVRARPSSVPFNPKVDCAAACTGHCTDHSLKNGEEFVEPYSGTPICHPRVGDTSVVR